ncbi:right-handed parallel beta-helix repeat-containing protein [Kineosporia rhizophila]|uniref:right-handed parallel beta-helix repeat-containing protein n=1 Tax=Kineosporia rhizophila TaxID=84633 RepID=UPI001E56182A|nr:right-handed parallel beta-helix repeat-containing protein [Kineosporia rhizophila]MCE0538749.1 right-handed parallel beta-helix repeat-containing protein [Kineosporia rhizophila]
MRSQPRTSPRRLISIAGITGVLIAGSATAYAVSPLSSSTSVTAAATGATYYVAPNGSDTAAGSKSAPWKSIARAQTAVSAGDTVYFRAGTYAFTAATKACSSRTALVDAITLSKSGTAAAPITYAAYPGEKPVFNFSAMKDDCRIKGLNVTGSYLNVKGLELTGVRQNNNLNHESWGVYVTGSNNTFDQLNLHHHMGPGLFIKNGSNNLVLNSDSHDNYDLYTSNGAGESADGFGAHVAANQPGNRFSGNRAWNNSDDGFDLINAYSPVTIENSWAWHNGYVPGTETAAGNGSGIKAGGYGGVYQAAAVKHTVRYSVAFNNRAAGFYANHHPVALNFNHNTAYNNRPNYNMLGITSGGAATGLGNLHDNVAFGGTLTSNLGSSTQKNNSWNLSTTLTSKHFQSLSTTGWDAARQSNGRLPVLTSLRPAAGSPLTGTASDAATATTKNIGAF